MDNNNEDCARRAVDELQRLQAHWLAPSLPSAVLLESHLPRLLLHLLPNSPGSGSDNLPLLMSSSGTGLVSVAASLPSGGKAVRKWFQHLAGPHLLHSKESGRRAAGLLLLAASVPGLPPTDWSDTVAPLTNGPLLDLLKRSSDGDSEAAAEGAAAWQAVASIVSAASAWPETARDVGLPLAARAAPLAVRHLQQPDGDVGGGRSSSSRQATVASAVCVILAAAGPGPLKHQLPALIEHAVAACLNNRISINSSSASLSFPSSSTCAASASAAAAGGPFAQLTAAAAAASGEAVWRSVQLGLLRGALAVVRAFVRQAGTAADHLMPAAMPPPPAADELPLPSLGAADDSVGPVAPRQAALRFEKLSLAVTACWASGRAGWALPVGAVMSVVSAAAAVGGGGGTGRGAAAAALNAGEAETELAVAHVQLAAVRLLRSLLLAGRGALLPWSGLIGDLLLRLLQLQLPLSSSSSSASSSASRRRVPPHWAATVYETVSTALSVLGSGLHQQQHGGDGLHGPGFVASLLGDHLLPDLERLVLHATAVSTISSATGAGQQQQEQPSSQPHAQTSKRRRLAEAASSPFGQHLHHQQHDNALESRALAAAAVAEMLAAELPALLEPSVRARLDGAVLALLLSRGAHRSGQEELTAALVRLLTSSLLTAWPGRSPLLPQLAAVCAQLRPHPSAAVRAAASRALSVCSALARPTPLFMLPDIASAGAATVPVSVGLASSLPEPRLMPPAMTSSGHPAAAAAADGQAADGAPGRSFAFSLPTAPPTAAAAAGIGAAPAGVLRPQPSAPAAAAAGGSGVAALSTPMVSAINDVPLVPAASSASVDSQTEAARSSGNGGRGGSERGGGSADIRAAAAGDWSLPDIVDEQADSDADDDNDASDDAH